MLSKLSSNREPERERVGGEKGTEKRNVAKRETQEEWSEMQC